MQPTSCSNGILLQPHTHTHTYICVYTSYTLYRHTYTYTHTHIAIHTFIPAYVHTHVAHFLPTGCNNGIPLQSTSLVKWCSMTRARSSQCVLTPLSLVCLSVCLSVCLALALALSHSLVLYMFLSHVFTGTMAMSPPIFGKLKIERERESVCERERKREREREIHNSHSGG